mmetsp:Transcript_5904/g.18249  ORF Transcript_5904/g.18249 Transcript_5904/m.18249 type:complete len:296 (+) Transcript_5904:457-1344(+)
MSNSAFKYLTMSWRDAPLWVCTARIAIITLSSTDGAILFRARERRADGDRRTGDRLNFEARCRVPPRAAPRTKRIAAACVRRWRLASGLLRAARCTHAHRERYFLAERHATTAARRGQSSTTRSNLTSCGRVLLTEAHHDVVTALRLLRAPRGHRETHANDATSACLLAAGARAAGAAHVRRAPRAAPRDARQRRHRLRRVAAVDAAVERGDQLGRRHVRRVDRDAHGDPRAAPAPARRVARGSCGDGGENRAPAVWLPPRGRRARDRGDVDARGHVRRRAQRRPAVRLPQRRGL